MGLEVGKSRIRGSVGGLLGGGFVAYSELRFGALLRE